MRRLLTCLVALLVLAAAGWTAPRACAQAPRAADREKAAPSPFADLYQRWQDAQDPEQKITLGEQLVALERSLASWPLEAAREHVRGELAFVLGSAYVTRLVGVRADNLEKGIAHLEAALGVWTREADPQNWARTHSNVGVAYWGRIRGERADNQEKAIAHFEAAVTILTHGESPQEWARLQNNLAVVYLYRARGDRASNIETAIAHFADALTVFTRDSDAFLWAQIQNNLGAAYRGRVDGDPADNKEKAIAHLEAALSVLTRDASPLEWASAQSNLAVVYLGRARGDQADNQDKALAHLEASLTFFTRDASPQQWATVQRNIGNVYSDRVSGERADNRSRAIAAYEAALSVFTRDAFPQDHMTTSRNLGRLLLEAGDWRKAGLVHASAREAFLLLFGQGLEEAQARTVISDAGPLFAEAAFGALQRGETEVALELAGEGRARLTAVALKLQTLELPAGKRRRLDKLRIAIRAVQQAVDAAQGTERAAAIEKLVALRQELLGLVKSSGQGRSGGALAEARNIAATGSAVVMPVITSLGGKLVLAAKGRDLTVIDLPELTTHRLAELLAGPGDQPGGWTRAYLMQFWEGDEREQRWSEWLAAIDNLGPELWDLFAGRLDAALRERGIKPGARIVWLPTGWLGILPLGVAQDPISKRRLADDYEIAYAPSLETLAAAYRHPSLSAPATLAAIINPTGDLAGADMEGSIIASHFASGARTLLHGQAATPDAVLAALKGRTHWHFASHGTFSWDDARQSGLVLRGSERLSVGRLLEANGLGRPRLVVLSACETGLSDIRSNPDEFIGLPAAFTALGAAGVLGTLWPVSDTATALLIARFYELHIGGRLPPATALHRAQSWLREATNAELQAYARSAATRGRLDTRQLAAIEDELSAAGLARSRNRAIVRWIGPDGSPAAGAAAAPGPTALAHPYAHPYWWAGFIYTGL